MSTGTGFTPPSTPECPYAPRMTRAAAQALAASGGLKENCVVVLITDTPVIGTAGNTSPTEIELNPVSPTAFGQTARVFTTFGAEAWPGVYDLANNAITELRDDFGNTAKDVDATAPTVHTQVPWHLGSATFRDNYFEDSTLIGLDTAVGIMRNVSVSASTVDFTGKTTGSWIESEIQSSTITTGVSMGLSNSKVMGASTLAGTSAGAINLTNSVVEGSASVINDPGSLKTWSFNSSFVQSGCVLRSQAGTVAKTASISFTTLTGRVFTNSILWLGDTMLTFNRSYVEFTAAWTLDGAGGATTFNINEADMRACTVTRSAVAGRFDFTSGRAVASTFDHQGSGTMNCSQGNVNTGSIIRSAAGSVGDLSVQGSIINGGTVLVTAVRSLSLVFCSVVDAQGIVTCSGATATAIATTGDRLDGTHVAYGGHIEFATTTGANSNEVSRCTVRGSSVAAHGLVRFDGTSDGVWLDASQILGGSVTVSNAASGLSGATALHDLHVDAGSVLNYTGGDSTAKQIRNIHVEGQSTVTLTNLTGSAGAGLGDVFGMSVRGQSTLTVTGARVVGQPVRDCAIEQGSTLNVDPSGCAQMCRVASAATLNTGAFTHFNTEVSLSGITTLTAANVDRLRNKGFSDVI